MRREFKHADPLDELAEHVHRLNNMDGISVRMREKERDLEGRIERIERALREMQQGIGDEFG